MLRTPPESLYLVSVADRDFGRLVRKGLEEKERIPILRECRETFLMENKDASKARTDFVVCGYG
jgi:hypothetical protein